MTTTTPSRRGWNLRILNQDPEKQRKARAAVRPESNAANGRKGYEATKAKLGEALAGEFAANWRRTHPNQITQRVMAWLDEFCVAFTLEEPIKRGDATTYADVCVRDFNLIIEVDGHGYHQDNPRDAWKDDLYRALGWRVLRLAEADIRSGAAHEQLDCALHAAPAAARGAR